MTIRERPIRQYPDLIVTLAANEQKEITRTGRKFLCMSVTTDEAVKIGLDQEPIEWLYTQVGSQLPPEEGVFTRINLLNTTGSPQTVKIKTSMGDVVDNRLALIGGSISVDAVPSNNLTTTQVTIPATSSHDIAADPTRRAVMFMNHNNGVGILWIQDTSAALADRGTPLFPQSLVEVRTAAAIRVYNPNGGPVPITYNLFKRV